MSKSLKEIHYRSYGNDPNIAQYRLFSPTEIHGRNVACVFSNVVAPCGLNTDNCILADVVAKERLSIEDTAFYELQTHIGWNSLPRGCYEFIHITPKMDERGHVYAGGWQHVPCPLIVFETFREIIGTFQEADELISADNPRYGKTYAKYKPEKLEEERAWARREIDRREYYANKSREEHAKKILSVQEAMKRGYRFDPMADRHCSLPSDISKLLSEGVVVDLVDSHLLGQQAYRIMGPDLGRPERFVVWPMLNS